MKNFLPFILLQLVFIGYSVQVPGNVQSTYVFEDSPDEHLPQDVIRRPNKTHFIDLNADVLHSIFSHLRVQDYLQLSKAFPQLSPLINDAFQQKYRNNQLRIQAINTIESDTISEYFNGIVVDGVRIFREVTKQFGHLIKRIYAYNQGITEYQSKTINEIIQEYCADTLVDLDLEYIKTNTFAQFTKPLANLQRLSFDVGIDYVREGVLTLDNLCPRLERLELWLHSNNNNYSFINYHFPHLKSLLFRVAGPSIARAHKEQLDDILRKNPQITEIEIHDFPKDYVKVVHELLPNITKLILHEFDIGDEEIHFEHVTNFTLYGRESRSVENFSFSNLTSLNMFEYPREKYDSLKRFLRKYNNLLQFKVSSIDGQELPLIELTEDLEDLVEIDIRTICHIRVEIICQFIDSHENLNKLRLWIYKPDPEYLNQLRERYQHDWHVKIEGYVDVDVRFERKVTGLN